MSNIRKVLYNSPYAAGPSAIRWIVSSWEEGFKKRGYDFHICENQRLLEGMCNALKPTILFCDIVSTPIEDSSCRDILKRTRTAGSKIGLNVFWPLLGQPESRAEALKRYDIADIYCGEKEPDSMQMFERVCGKTYHTMPHAANPRYHYPVPPEDRYRYDLVFMGGKLPHKRWFNDNIIATLRRKYRLGLFGPYWTLRDNCFRAVSKLARLAKRPALARFVDRFRIYIPEEDENRLYSSSKISLNFHERDADLTQSHHIVNQRTFKIAACGGFQIVDPVVAMPKYFGSDEIVTADLDPRDWLAKVAYYLEHEDERRVIQKRATDRAHREHMADHRVQLLERWLGLT
jgi:spore maturation protein CgeB